MSQRVLLLSVILFLFWDFSASSQKTFNFYIGNSSEETLSNAAPMAGNEVPIGEIPAGKPDIPEQPTYRFERETEEENVAAGFESTAFSRLPPENLIYQLHKPPTLFGTPETVDLNFTIEEPNWFLWSLLLVALMCLLHLLSFCLLNLHHRTKTKELRKGISTSLHDELGSHLTLINFLSTSLSQTALKAKDLKEYLAQINSEALASTIALDEIVWNMDMRDENLDELVARMRKYAGEVLETVNLRYTIVMNSSFAKKKMSMQKRRDLFLIFKELLNNICKHSKAGMVEITISKSGSGIFLSVKDDGLGFDRSLKTERNGIRSITYRVEKCKGDFRITAGKGEGCLVELWLPFCQPIYRKGIIPRNKPPRIQ